MRPWYDGTMLVVALLAAVVTAATFTLQFHLPLCAFLKPWQRDHNVTQPARGRALPAIRFFRSDGITRGMT
jgi:hypothetical protein